MRRPEEGAALAICYCTHKDGYIYQDPNNPCTTHFPERGQSDD